MHQDALPEARQRLSRYQYDRDQARKVLMAAQQAVTEAQHEVDLAESAFDAAQVIYNAALKDISAPAKTPASQEIAKWLLELQRLVHFDTPIMTDAAQRVGWDVTAEALRQTVKRYTDKGLFVREGRGAYRVNQQKLGAITASELTAPIDDITHDEPPPDSAADTEATDLPRNYDDDWREDDY